jgi:glycerol uptake facilitator-like aquaporin
MTVRKLKPVQCLFYIIGQVAGAFGGAFLVYWLYWDLFNRYDGGVRHVLGANGTAEIFFTMPAAGVSHWTAFLEQIVGTAVLMIFIMALGQVSCVRETCHQSLF